MTRPIQTPGSAGSQSHQGRASYGHTGGFSSLDRTWPRPVRGAPDRRVCLAPQASGRRIGIGAQHRPVLHPATPSSVLPARELLADMLLELNQPAAALVEYRAMLSTDPNRFRSLLGEARAAKQTGDSATAHDAYRKLLALSKPVGPARPELAEARSYLTS
jgi:hypothetical protein